MSIKAGRIAIDETLSVSSLVRRPSDAHAAFVFAHGAGAGMDHAFMTSFAEGLAARGIATLRYQFPFMERGSKRVDPPALSTATVRAACQAASERFAGLPLFAGGKSFGGRMTSQAQADRPLDAVRGLAFVGFPLHPAKAPATARADHLAHVTIPLLFLQGTRDDLADAMLIADVVATHGPAAELVSFPDADHAFHVRKQSGSDDDRTREAMLDALVAWIARVSGAA